MLILSTSDSFLPFCCFLLFTNCDVFVDFKRAVEIKLTWTLSHIRLFDC